MLVLLSLLFTARLQCLNHTFISCYQAASKRHDHDS